MPQKPQGAADRHLKDYVPAPPMRSAVHLMVCHTSQPPPISAKPATRNRNSDKHIFPGVQWNLSSVGDSMLGAIEASDGCGVTICSPTSPLGAASAPQPRGSHKLGPRFRNGAGFTV